jgi:hypothetical protein
MLMVSAALKVRPIRRLVVAYGVNQLGDWAGEMALAVAIYAATGSAGAVALLWVVHRAALALLAPLLVARLADLPRARVLIAIYVAQAGLFLALIAAMPIGLRAVVPLLAVDGLLAPTARALARTTMSTIAGPRGLLREANGVLNVVFTVNGLLAPILGGLMVAATSPRAALAVNAASFVVAALAIGPLRVPATRHDAVSAAGRLTAALRFARAQAVVGGLLVGDLATTVFIAMITPVEVAFVCGTLGAGTGALGAVLAAWGAGMVAGGALAARLRQVSLPALLAAAAAAPAVACLGMGAAHAIGQVVVCSAIGGLGNGAYGMAFLTTLQERTPAVHQACVNALYDLVGSVAPGLGFVAAGVIAASSSARAVYFVAGAGALAALAATAALLRDADWSPAALAFTGPDR